MALLQAGATARVLAAPLPEERDPYAGAERLGAPVVDLGYPYRTAKSVAVVVPAGSGPEFVSLAIVGVGLAGVQRFIHQKLVGSAMELIGSRLHCDVQDATAHLAIFGREVR